jgi:hypothetical protein
MGSFSIISLLLSRLPPGSQAAICNTKEAYRTLSIKPSQWSGIVIRLQGEDRFAIDTRNCFGLAAGAGCYGKIGNTVRATAIAERPVLAGNPKFNIFTMTITITT